MGYHTAVRDAVTKQRSNSSLNALRGSKNPARALVLRRRVGSLSELVEIVRAVESHPHYARLIPAAFPATLPELNDERMVLPISADRDIVWACARCLASARALERFAEQASGYESAVLLGEFEGAARTLKVIESAFGTSLWLIQAQIQLVQLQRGYDAQAELAREIQNRAKREGTSSLIAYLASTRSDPSISYSKLLDIVTTITASNPNSNYSSYLRFHADHPSTGDLDFVHRVVTAASEGSVIDCFRAVRFASHAMTHASWVLSDDAIDAVATVCAQVSDKMLRRLASGPSEPSAALAVATDLLLCSRYQEAYSIALSEVRRDPTDPDGVLIAALSLAGSQTPDASGTRTPIESIVRDLAHFFATGDVSSPHVSSLQKLAADWQLSPLSCLLKAVTETDRDEPQAALLLSAAHASPSLHPLWLRWAAGGCTPFLVAREKATSGWLAVATDHIASLTAEPVEATAPHAESLLSAAVFPNGRDLKDVQRALNNAVATERHPFYQRAMTRELIGLDLKLGGTATATKRLATALSKYPEWQHSLPIARVASSIASEPTDGVELETAIVMERHFQLHDHRADIHVVSAFVRTLEAYGVSRPSQLAGDPEIEKTLLGRFLRYVALESVLERAGVCDSSAEVAEERLDVCEALIRLDAGGEAAFQDEIKQISRRLVVERRLKEVERSKVFIDITRLKSEVSEKLRESFAHYRALRAGKDLPLVVLSFSADSQAKPVVRFAYDLDELTQLLSNLIEVVRDAYAGHPDYGLDKYLSVRIRHGTFTGHLRAPIYDAALITTREAGAASYRRNERWPSEVFPYSQYHQDKVATRLARFSIEIDALLEGARARLTVASSSERQGLFRFPIAPQAVARLERVIASDGIDCDAFVDRVIAECDQSLDRSLQAVRNYLDGDVKQNGTRLLQELLADVEDLGGNTSAMSNAINQASVAWRVACDRVREWFRRGTLSVGEPVSIDEVVEVALASVKRIARQFHVDTVQADATGRLYRGVATMPLVDVLFTVFDNIAKHSGLDRPIAELRVQHGQRGTIVRCENALGAGVKASSVAQAFASIKATIKDGDGSSAIVREGGTGLLKLARIMANDLSSVDGYDFGITDAGRVFVEFTIPPELVVKDESADDRG